jgi:hypothetical protein
MSLREIELGTPAPNLHGRELYDYEIGRLPPYVPPVRRRKEPRPVPIADFAPTIPRRKPVTFKRPVYSLDDSEKLYDLVVTRKGGIKYNPRLVTKETATQYLSDKNLEDKYNVLSGDFDNDVNTPDNVIVVDEQGRRRYIDGYSLIARRPEVLYADEFEDMNYSVKSGNMTKQEADIKKRDLKKYNKTHVTAQSREDEPIDVFLSRVGNERKFSILHKLYLDKFPKEQRNENTERNYKTYVLTTFPDIAIGPAMLVRRTIAAQIKGLEAQGHRFRDKLGLINALYQTTLDDFRKSKNIPGDYKLIGDDYLQIVLALRENKIGNYKNVLSTFVLPALS